MKDPGTAKAPKTVTPTRCPRCDRRWTGAAQAHCPTCHEHFSGIKTFDLHRRNDACLTPGSIVNKRDEAVLEPRTGIYGITWGSPSTGESWWDKGDQEGDR